MIFVDFETRSHVDLKRCGVYRYATDPSTEVICAAIHFDGLMHVWRNPKLYPGDENDEILDLLARHMDSTDDMVCAHNASFDRLIWEHCTDFPPAPTERWICTAYQARVNALPGALDAVGRFLKLPQQKAAYGRTLIKQLCIPPFEEDRGALDQFMEYCSQDLRTTMLIPERLRPLTEQEHRDWVVCEHMNDYGVHVDLHFAQAAVKLAERERAELTQQVRDLTGEDMTSATQVRRLVNRVVAALNLPDTPDGEIDPELEPVAEVMRKTRKDGTRYWAMGKPERAELIKMHEEGTFWLPGRLYEIVCAVHEANRSSVAKFQNMLDRATGDAVCGAFLAAGAGQTQRFSSQGLQLHNMRRDCFASRAEFDQLYAKVVDGTLRDDVNNTLSRLLRPTICAAPHHKLVCADWSSIEARALPWLADSSGGEEVLDVFREGRDLYVEACKRMGLADRQIGKVATLSLGYGGGHRALDFMARNYGIELGETQARDIVQRWRHANPWATTFWHALTDAAMRAVLHPQTDQGAGRVRYRYEPYLVGGTLLCVLPGGVVLQYTHVRVAESQYGPVLVARKPSLRPKANEAGWPKMTLWHGLLAENVTQAVCAALLRNVVRHQPLTVMHTHDEIVLEVPASEAEAAEQKLTAAMCAPPEWAAGLPLAVESYITDRYGVKYD
jgi:DNA polymerase